MTRVLNTMMCFGSEVTSWRRKRSEFVSSATTLRVRSGKVLITDGPFAETNDQIGGFILIEAKDLNEAIQLASRIPAIRLGAVEVRPVKELTHSASGDSCCV